ncbi:transglycosylase domain-containing protein [Hyphomicrobium sp.]|uniref:transglycosylase domain-containing protein n=1 Tax=Hyphomicrobium sp. TaxID=82 RepID=UPI003F726FB0
MDYDGRDHRPPYHPDGPHYQYPPQSYVPVEAAETRAWSGRFSDLPLRFRLLVLAPVAAFCAAAVCIGALFIYYTVAFPDPLSMRLKSTGPVIRIVGHDGSPIAERGVSRAYVPLDMLPARVTNAVVATEDRRFFAHHGLDPLGLLRATLVNLKSGRLTQGGSTITQQLAKNLFLSSDRTFARKAEEVVLALWLELRLSKTEILELYVNRVYFGGGAHGIEAASQRYFGKSARELTLPEAAVIAGLLKAPSKYAPSSSPVQAVTRGRVVIGKMLDAGFITEEDAREARAAEVRFSPLMRVPDQADMAYAVDYVLDASASFEGSDRDEIVIETTLDAGLQRRTGEIVEKTLAASGATLNAGQAAVVVLAPDGGIRALVGGRSYADSQFNRAVKAHRQPGSAFKPVVYLTALERGLTPDSVVVDEPIRDGRWSPKNDNGRHVGATTLRNALAQSINTVSVRLLLDAGADKVAATARRLGMTSPLKANGSLALGTSEVSLLDLAGAYAAFANGGYVNAPYAIRRIRTGDGKVLFQRLAARSAPAIPRRSVAAMNDMLSTAVQFGTGRRAAIAGHMVAGKTGTTQDFRDAWFVGYTAHLTAGVWVGNDDGQSMNKVVGGSLPAEIWHGVMEEAHRGLAPLPLPDAAGRSAPLADAEKAHPVARIEADFIAKALTPATLAEAEAVPSDRGASRIEGAAGQTTVTGTSRIVVRPPRAN